MRCCPLPASHPCRDSLRRIGVIVAVGELCCALDVFVLVLDVSVPLSSVGMIAVEGNDECKKTEEGEEQQETLFYGINKIWKQDTHPLIRRSSENGRKVDDGVVAVLHFARCCPFSASPDPRRVERSGDLSPQNVWTGGSCSGGSHLAVH